MERRKRRFRVMPPSDRIKGLWVLNKRGILMSVSVKLVFFQINNRQAY
jgi:hypothetical protein